MERAFGLEIPRTLEEVCDPKRKALLVYDMQVGILNQEWRSDYRARRPGAASGP